ncbi:hypothetical protein FSP39_012092 [Pinctada imbricata]|uniref:DEP domain-containing protein n=1 Tax=Pinctada imbricata TaxID=66713 RepID=A0AA88YIP0_PINIB|nr:hypothetical protein FSP39_012092 [Pinctada imbricata]
MVNSNSIRWGDRKGPFRATQIWNEIVDHMKSNIVCKRHRLKMRNYDNCFTGAHAVDVVMTYLLSDRNTFSTDLSRDKAIKLCQSLMDRHVFSSVSSRSSEVKKGFDDSHNKLFRFVNPDSESNINETSTIIETSSDEDQDYSIVEDGRGNQSIRISSENDQDFLDDSIICNPVAVNKKGQVLHEIINLHQSFTRRKSRSSLKADTSILSRSGKEKTAEVSPSAIEGLWKEVALCQLLTIIDLPFLDGILTADKNEKKHIKQNIVISNVVAKHYNMPANGINNVTDSVMRSALNCIECLPKGLLVLEREFVKECHPAAKIQAFQVLSEHYSKIEEPLLPERFLDLHLNILNLVLQQKNKLALEALQLDMIILPWNIKEELHRLLKFMSACASLEEFQLDSKVDNENLILDTFTDCIIRHKVVAHKLARVLVLFLMNNLQEIFTIPKIIKDRVASRMDDLKTGEVSPVRDITYCSQVSLEQYKKQAVEGTKSALVDMMNGILDNTTISLKEKKQRLKQFQKCHPQLYAQHFSEML